MTTKVQLVSNIVGNVSGGASFTGIVTASSFSGSITGTTGTASTATAAGTAYGLTGSPNITVGNINSSGVVTATTFSGNITGTAATFTGNVSIAGTLTYEDVTNVDSVGVITARSGIVVSAGGANITGVVTATGGIQAIGIQSAGTNVTTGVITAINFVGTGNTFQYNAETKIIDISISGGGASSQWVTASSGIHTLSSVGIGTTNPTVGVTSANTAVLAVGIVSAHSLYSNTWSQPTVAVSALDINCSTGNYFTKTIAADSTFTFSNAPSSRAYSFALQVTHTSGTITWPAAVKWPNNTAPTLTTGRTHIFMFGTINAGSTWYGSYLVDYN